MAMIELSNISFSYPDEKIPTLKEISFEINHGEFVAICGPTGCGKSTLLRLLKHEIKPVGSLRGSIFFEGVSIEDESNFTPFSKDVGIVFQDPEQQIVMDEVINELVFGLENSGLSTSEMRRRVAEIVHFFGLENLLKKKSYQLSGGEKQRLNLASVLALQPRVLLLDEPISQLDPVASREFLKMLRQVNEDFGITVIMVEHRLDDVFTMADKFIAVEDGKIKYSGTPINVIKEIWNQNDDHFKHYIPAVSSFFLKHCKTPLENIPLTVKEGKKLFYKIGKTFNEQQLYGDLAPTIEQEAKKPLLSCNQINFQYDKTTPPILNHLSLNVNEGDFLAVVGGNGTGKSTLIKLLGGLLKPQKGYVSYLNKKLSKFKEHQLYKEVSYLPQNPRQFIIHETVNDELLFAAEKLSNNNTESRIDYYLSMFNINHLKEKHPYDCSGGEIQKVALACLLLAEPKIILIDEPTKGLDPVSRKMVGEQIKKLHKEGLTIVMVTHDIEFAARYANRCMMLFDGEITAEGSPEEFFRGNFFYTTTINRMVRDLSRY